MAPSFECLHRLTPSPGPKAQHVYVTPNAPPGVVVPDERSDFASRPPRAGMLVIEGLFPRLATCGRIWLGRLAGVAHHLTMIKDEAQRLGQNVDHCQDPQGAGLVHGRKRVIGLHWKSAGSFRSSFVPSGGVRTEGQESGRKRSPSQSRRVTKEVRGTW
jgi:hypothetical protein